MSWHLRALSYYIILTFVTAVVYALPAFADLLTIGVAGLLPTIWLYVTALLPAFAMRAAGLKSRACNIVGIASLVAVAILPAQIARPIAERIQAEMTAGDFAPQLPSRPQWLEFVRRSSNYFRDIGRPLGDAKCDPICQRLLLKREAKFVTIRALRSKELGPVIITYRIEARTRCPLAFDEGHEAIAMTVEANLSGICIVPAFGDVMVDGLSIHEDLLESHIRPGKGLVDVKKIIRLKIANRRAGVDNPLLQRTEVLLGKTSAPTRLFSYWGILTSVSGWALAKRPMSLNNYELPDFLFREMGLKVIADESIHRPTWADDEEFLRMRLRGERIKPNAALVASILDKSGSEPFGPEVEKVFDNWSAQYWHGKKKPNTETLALFSRILLDRRIYPANGIKNVLTGNRGLISEFSGEILTRLSWPEPERRYIISPSFAHLIARHLTKEELQKHATKITQVLATNFTANTSPLLIAAARLGHEGLPFVLAGLQADDMNIVNNAIAAACSADPSLEADLTPAITALLTNEKYLNSRDEIIVSLAGLKGLAAADQAINLLPSAGRAQMKALLEKRRTTEGTINCFR